MTGTSAETGGDLNSREAIHTLVQTFYGRVLDDPLLRPVFLEVAGVDLEHHLPTIEAYWRKMLLGEKGAYQRHMVKKHEAVHNIKPLRPEHFQRWGEHFHATLNEHFTGPYTDKAHRIADRILANLQEWLSPPGGDGAAD